MSDTNLGALTRVHKPHAGNFKEGWAGGPGRPKGAKNRMQVDLAEMIVRAAANVGYFVVGKDGMPVQGERGTLGYLEWCAMHEPKTFMGLLARVLPYHVLDERPEKHILTREEALEQLRERGLPVDLLNILHRAPQPLDPGEDPDPYGMAIDGEVSSVSERPFGTDDTADTGNGTK